MGDRPGAQLKEIRGKSFKPGDFKIWGGGKKREATPGFLGENGGPFWEKHL